MTYKGHRDFEAHSDSPRAARSFAVDMLRAAGVAAPTQQIAALVVSELSTNAIIHTHSAFSLDVEIRDETIRIEVADTSRTLPPRSAVPSSQAHGGRGLAIVDQLCQSWGAHSVGGNGKIVWGELTREVDDSV